MKELMSQDTSTSRSCTEGIIQWSQEDVYGQVIGPENPGHVRGLGLGPTPGRSRCSSFRASTSASQVPELVSEVNQLKDQVTQMQMARDKQDSEMTEMTKLIAMLMEGNAHRENAPNIISKTTFLPVMPKLSVGNGTCDILL
jgi:predicted Mrr-cat superfamily restriction endonuclease